jgi:hypothetical protein
MCSLSQCAQFITLEAKQHKYYSEHGLTEQCQDLNLRPLLPQGRGIKGYEPYIEKLLGIINKVVG